MNGYIQVATTAAGKKEAEALASVLIEKRLAACVQIIGPMTSRYRWQGKIEVAEEYLCLAKSRREFYPAIEAAIREKHSYEVPEVVATPLIAGSGPYLAWLDDELGEAG